MTVKSVKRMAADILNVGINKIRIKPENIKQVLEAFTHADVNALINDGTIDAKEKKGRRKKEKKRKRGAANIRGRPSTDRKKKWMKVIRSQRAYLKKMVSTGVLDKKHKRIIYGRIKSGMFKSKKTLLTYLKENGFVKADKLAAIVEEKKTDS